MDNYTVYKHTSPSGKVYIGLTGRKPAKRYDGGRGYNHCPHFRAAIQKYGWENFHHEILAEKLTREEAAALEVRLIAEYKSDDRRYGYNADKGGFAPGKASAETREKIAANMRGDKNPTRRYGHPFKGRHHTEESRKKMSAAASARVGRVVSEQTRKNLRRAQRKTPVRDLSTGAVYDGIHTAEETTGVPATKICAVCRGRRNTAGGRRWEYVKEDTHE